MGLRTDPAVMYGRLWDVLCECDWQWQCSVCIVEQPSNVKEEDIDGTVMDDVDGIPLEELDGTPLDGEPLKDKTDDDVNGVPLKSIVPYGDDIDGEPGSTSALYGCLPRQLICSLCFDDVDVWVNEWVSHTCGPATAV